MCDTMWGVFESLKYPGWTVYSYYGGIEGGMIEAAYCLTPPVCPS